MDIQKMASAGTMESSDAYVEIEPAQGLKVSVDSVVQAQFGDAITRVVYEVLEAHQIDNARVHIMDRGALECVLRARVETAILRGKGNT
ncbi:MAG: citrate lyase acyl carrier protein [Ruminococcaceae bacterium]|nr:citrate lyase acyl carrier protein [Oscillospiraceae bacterium]